MAAVLLLLGDEIARRPATLLALRGVDVDAIAPRDSGEADETLAVPAEGSAFASCGAMLVRRLGPIPFWRGTERCVESLVKMQSRAGTVAQDAASGASIDLRG